MFYDKRMLTHHYDKFMLAAIRNVDEMHAHILYEYTNYTNVTSFKN